MGLAATAGYLLGLALGTKNEIAQITRFRGLITPVKHYEFPAAGPGLPTQRSGTTGVAVPVSDGRPSFRSGGNGGGKAA